MANQLKMAVAYAIITLNQRGWSNRRIAKELGIDRETVKRHLELARNGSKPATNAPLGSEGSKPATNAPPGSAVAEHGFAGSYYSVRRFVRRLGKSLPLPFRRMPGRIRCWPSILSRTC